MNQKNLRIVVICGGISSEREVSLRSGNAVYSALRNLGYQNAVLFDLTRDSLGELLQSPIDLAFLALHGKGGEDGCIQGLLELLEIPYTGSSVEASAICMNKIRTKEILNQALLPTPKFMTFRKEEIVDLNQTAQALIETIGLPMVLKSPCEGSSVGVLIVKEADALPAAIEEIFQYGNQLLAEQFMVGTELTLPILGNDTLTTLPIIEITSENEFYDYEAKYTQGMCHHIIPARIPSELQEQIAQIGKAAYRALGCSGLSRIDFMLNDRGEPMILEVNTLPGMTEMSLFPDAARSIGMSFGDLIEEIVRLAWERRTKELSNNE